MGAFKNLFINTDQDGLTAMMEGRYSAEEPAPTPETELQNGSLLRASDVKAMTTLDMKTIKRLIARSRFPAPVFLSDRRKAWHRSAVLEWMADPEGWECAF